MTASEKLVDDLRNQAYWINYMADQLEKGERVTCDWCIEPEFISQLLKEVSV